MLRPSATSSSSAASSLMMMNQQQSKYACIINGQIHPFRQFIQNQVICFELQFDKHMCSEIFKSNLYQHLTIYYTNGILPNITSVIHVNEKYCGTMDKNHPVLQLDTLYQSTLVVRIKEMNTVIFNSTFTETLNPQIDTLQQYKKVFYDNMNLNTIKNYIKGGKISVEYPDMDKMLRDENLKLNHELKKFKSILQIQLSDINDKLQYQTKNMSPNGATTDDQLIQWANKQFKLIESDMMQKYLNILQCVQIMKHFNSAHAQIIPNEEQSIRQIRLLFELIQDKSLDKISSEDLKSKRRELNYLIKQDVDLLNRFTSQ